MLQKDSLSDREIIQQLKFSCQLPSIVKDVYKTRIIRDTSEDKGIIISERELQEAADSFRFQNDLLSAEATFDWLHKNDLSTEDFELLIRDRALATKLASEMFSDEVESYFYEHELDYTKAVIYEIVIPDFNLALELFFSVQEKECSFWELAHKYITDIELRRRGGYRGLLTRDELKPEISAAVFATQPPQILKPILINKKAHLIYVEEIVKPELDRIKRREIIDLLLEQWLEKKL